MKKVTFPLVVILTLSLILGPMGCGKRPSAVIPPSIVESISPSSGASGVSADAAVTIQFKSPIWASQMTVPPDGEPLQLDSSELADRFRIIDSATGEIVPGRVSIQDGVKLIFELPVGESWKPNNTYWIEGTADASLEETYDEGAWQNLFLSAFTTQDLEALLTHPWRKLMTKEPGRTFSFLRLPPRTWMQTNSRYIIPLVEAWLSCSTTSPMMSTLPEA